jgi:hypothetical protein
MAFLREGDSEEKSATAGAGRNLGRALTHRFNEGRAGFPRQVRFPVYLLL